MRRFFPPLIAAVFVTLSRHTASARFVVSSSTASTRKPPPSSAINFITTLRGGNIDDSELAIEAFDWTSNLGAPAALVAGAVLATLVETREAMAPNSKDSHWIQVMKKTTRLLLLTSFTLEIISIFVTTVTGTMLLSHGDRAAGTAAGISYHSPMGFLRHNLEFEYLTARITFLQGLFNWLAAVALEASIPKPNEGAVARRMNYFISSMLVTIILAMLSFYNHHMTFYSNYVEMLCRYTKVVWHRYVWGWPPRPMAFLYIPSVIATIVLGYRAFWSDDETAAKEIDE